MKKGVDNFEECDIYAPIEEIAKGRKYGVRRQFPISNALSNKGNKRVELVIVSYHQRLVLALEIKYKKRGDSLKQGAISSDAEKLRLIKASDINKTIMSNKGYPLEGRVTGFCLLRAVIIVWRAASIVQQMKSESNDIQLQLKKLLVAALPECANGDTELTEYFTKGRPTVAIGNATGSIRAGSSISDSRFWVASLIQAGKRSRTTRQCK